MIKNSISYFMYDGIAYVNKYHKSCNFKQIKAQKIRPIYCFRTYLLLIFIYV